eukprot:CAMPEP_0172585662 /NCGR_PEP_ID=MMETSP1068-20121228/5060_1 /TAXON_ID=35684 /ORGANISM="Pseudopedinella elastica, Strain CCMP716" /LENGTH=91 /DNA_ID=CAMNT_0013380205 /DNA_START=50 /DNA_END=321 /DNA_ORIENTATION=+
MNVLQSVILLLAIGGANALSARSYAPWSAATTAPRPVSPMQWVPSTLPPKQETQPIAAAPAAPAYVPPPSTGGKSYAPWGVKATPSAAAPA